MTSDVAVTQPADVAGLVERLRVVANDLRGLGCDGVCDGMIEAANALVNFLAHHEAQERRIAELKSALRPFVDLGPQRGAWGVISKALDGLAPLTVTVTKAQMLAALALLTPIKDNSDAQ